MTATQDFHIQKGATFNPILKYAQPHLIVKTITGITRSGQAVVTCTHALTVDWPVYVVGVVGMGKINHRPEELKQPGAAYQGYYVSSSSIRLDVDSTRFAAYTSGGELVYHPPVDLTSYTARMQIREDIDDVAASISLTTENGGITLGATAGTISLLIAATATDDITWEDAVYDLEIISSGGIVTRLISGAITASDEVTR